MAFRIIRQRKEARKAAKIEEIFQEKQNKYKHNDLSFVGAGKG